MINTFLYTLLFIVIGVLYYKILVKRFDNYALNVILKLNIFKNHTTMQVDAIVNIIVATIFQIITGFTLVKILGFHLNSFFSIEINLISLLIGFLLGVAHLVCSNMSGTFFFFILRIFGGDQVKDQVEKVSNSQTTGWINTFKTATNSTSLHLVFLINFIYILTEELIFRGVILSAYVSIDSTNVFVPILLTTFLFVIAQIPGMPTIYHAIYPMSSSLTMSLIHGWLMIKTGNIIPLVIAHYTYFHLSTITFSNINSKSFKTTKSKLL